MNCFPLFSYSFFILLYAILFSFIFNPKLENIIMIFLFIVTFLCGYNLFMDLKKLNLFFEFEPIIDVFKDGAGLELVKIVLFSPFTSLFLFVLLMLTLFKKFSGDTSTNILYIAFLGGLLFITNMIQIGINMKNVSLSYIFMLPILMTLISLVFVLIGIYNIYRNSTGKTDPIPYSQLDPKYGGYYKITFIIEILIIALFLSYFVLFYPTKGGDKNMQFQLYTVVFISYLLSLCAVIFSSNVLNKKFLGNVS